MPSAYGNSWSSVKDTPVSLQRDGGAACMQDRHEGGRLVWGGLGVVNVVNPLTNLFELSFLLSRH